MTTCLEKSCSFGLLYVSFVSVCQILCVSLFPFWYRGWDVGCDYINSRSLPFYLVCMFMNDISALRLLIR